MHLSALSDCSKTWLSRLAVGSGLLYLGYRLGTRCSSSSSSSGGHGSNSSKPKFVGKSNLVEEDNRVLQYCLDHSTPLHPVQQKLINETMKHDRAIMMGAPEVVMLNAALIKALGGRKVLDIGVFTGASSLSAALALPADGQLIACDVSEEFTRPAQRYWREAGVEDKISLRIAPAMETLQGLIDGGQAGTFDFAFIDADKTSYDKYYEACLVLLRKGGVIAIDNTLWFGQVLDPSKNDPDTTALKALNEKIARDGKRVVAVQINIGDGLTLVVKQ